MIFHIIYFNNYFCIDYYLRIVINNLYMLKKNSYKLTAKFIPFNSCKLKLWISCFLCKI